VEGNGGMEQTLKTNANSRYMYSAFGVNIASELVLTGLPPAAAGLCDVEIVYGSMPEGITSPGGENVCSKVTRKEFVYQVAGVAGFYVTNGNKIVVQPECSDENEVRLYLLGLVMGALLFQRGVLVIHGNAVLVNGGCVIFAGVSGAGKSTMTAALHKRGHYFLADDVVAITFDKQGKPWVQPGFPQQKLWSDSIALLDIDTAKLRRMSKSWDKYAVPVAARVCEKPQPLSAIYEITAVACAEVTITPLYGSEKITSIISNTYYYLWLDQAGLKVPHFITCVALAKCLPVFRITRPLNIPVLDKQIQVWEESFSNLMV